MSTAQEPRAIRLYRLYCYISAFAYGLLIIADIIFMIRGKEMIRPYWSDIEYMPDWGLHVPGIIMLPTSILFLIGNFYLPNLKPDKKAYSIHFANIASGAAGVCCLPLCLPLCLMWFKDDVRAYFGLPPKSEGSSNGS